MRNMGNMGIRAAGAWLCLLLLPAPLRAEPLGRLFFTPEERATLNRERQLGSQPEPADPGNAILVLDGRVLSSSGRRTTWVNGRMLTERELIPAPLATLKAGESINPGSGLASDLLENGRLTVHRGNFAPPAGP